MYTCYKLPRPKNAEDEFVLAEIQNGGFALSDKHSKKRVLNRAGVLAQEKAKARELGSLAAASKKTLFNGYSKYG